MYLSEFHAQAPQATASEGLAQGPYTWRPERYSNPRPFWRKATNLSMNHHVPPIIVVYKLSEASPVGPWAVAERCRFCVLPPSVSIFWALLQAAFQPRFRERRSDVTSLSQVWRHRKWLFSTIADEHRRANSCLRPALQKWILTLH